MKSVSPTTVIGIAKVLVIVLCAIAWLFNLADGTKVALVMTFTNSTLSAVGFWKAKDASPSEPEGLERK